MNHQDFSRSLSVSTDTSQLTQDEVIKEVLREIIEEKYGDKVLSRVIGCETISEILVKLTLEFLHKKNIKSITRENKKEIKRLIETKRWSILEDSFDFGEEDIKLSLREIKRDDSMTLDKYVISSYENDRGEVEFKIQKEEYFYPRWMDDYRSDEGTEIKIYNREGLHIKTKYIEIHPSINEFEDLLSSSNSYDDVFKPNPEYHSKLIKIERNPTCINGLYKLECKLIYVKDGKERIINNFTIDLPEACNPSNIPNYRDLYPIIKMKLNEKKTSIDTVEETQRNDTYDERFEKDIERYPVFRRMTQNLGLTSNNRGDSENRGIRE